jgi:DMSO/TMAO reductase YedYZ molybdopterin-dependent catalytic subunit
VPGLQARVYLLRTGLGYNVIRADLQEGMMLFPDSSERKHLESERRADGRLPPGQSLTLKWPVLHEGSIPHFNPEAWDFRIEGLVAKSVRLTWKEFSSLPRAEIRCDIHCVTRWSRFDNRFEGVLFTEVMKLVAPKPEARYALIHAENGYTTNLPLADLMRPTTMFAFKHDGEDLTGEHGYPVRLLVPHLYFWKSAKWVRGFELLAEDNPGFWERNGYHLYGDPWKEERFDTD